MALTITDEGNGNSAVSGASLSTGATIDASVDDWLVALVAADNAGTNGAASLTSVTDSQGNTWSQRALINFDPGAANEGATLGIFTAPVTNPLSSGTVTANFSPNTTAKTIDVKRVQPGAGETIEFVAADTTGLTGNTATFNANIVSVADGDTIFGCVAMESRDSTVAGGAASDLTVDTDTTNGSWSAATSVIADGGTAGASMGVHSQHKTVNATGNQDWAITGPNARDSARSYLILRAVPATIIGSTSLTFTTSGTAKAKRLASGSASLAFTTQGAALRKAMAAGTTSLTFTATAVPTGGAIAGTTSLTFGTSATLRGRTSLVATTSLTLSPTAALKGFARRSGQSSLSFTAAASAEGKARLIGATSLTFTVSAFVHVDHGPGRARVSVSSASGRTTTRSASGRSSVSSASGRITVQ